MCVHVDVPPGALFLLQIERWGRPKNRSIGILPVKMRMRADLGDFQRVISHSNFFLPFLGENSSVQKAFLPFFSFSSLLRDELPFDGH